MYNKEMEATQEKEMEKVGRKSEGDRNIESRDTERESSHPHTVRGSKYQALCCHLSAANARQSVRRTRPTDIPAPPSHLLTSRALHADQWCNPSPLAYRCVQLGELP